MASPAIPPKLVSLEQLADQLGVHCRTIRRRIASGDLPAYRVGQQIRIDPRDAARVLLAPMNDAARVLLEAAAAEAPPRVDDQTRPTTSARRGGAK